MDGPLRDFAAALNKSPGGWAKALGLKYLRATADEAVVELPVHEQHLKADGTVDEALYSGLVEAAASAGAALHAMRSRLLVVGVENQTSFHRPARSARLRVTAKPLMRDKDTQLWEGQVTDEHGQVIASGRVRLVNVKEGPPLTTPLIDLAGN